MQSIVNFLEYLGGDAGACASGCLQAAVADRPEAERVALLTGDSAALALLAGARVSLVCAVAAPDNSPIDEPEQPADVPEEPDEKAA